jgi:hypothetical protein
LTDRARPSTIRITTRHIAFIPTISGLSADVVCRCPTNPTIHISQAAKEEKAHKEQVIPRPQRFNNKLTTLYVLSFLDIPFVIVGGNQKRADGCCGCRSVL